MRAISRHSLLWIAAATGVFLPAVIAFAVPPFQGTRANEAGTVTASDIDHVSQPNNGWAIVFANEPNKLIQGTVKLKGKEWKHAYTQNHCPAGFTILGTGVDVVERRWLLPLAEGNPEFIQHPTNPEVGQPNGEVNDPVRVTIAGKPFIEISNMQFKATPTKVFWQANTTVVETKLASLRKIKNQNGTFWRHAQTKNPRSATISLDYPNLQKVQVDVCEQAKKPNCGDGNLDAGEECDDGDTDEGDGCNANCVEEYCGNAYWEEAAGEECDDGNSYDEDGCSSMCLQEYCGDGITQTALGEECDDGNGENGDGCNVFCEEEYCGDGEQQPNLSETCDDGNTNDEDGCSSMCLQEYCGDGITQTALGEECDDGGTQTGDGCDGACLIEW